MKAPWRQACWLALATSCGPTWQDDAARVVAPTIIAVTLEPPEATPGTAVTMTAVAATPQGVAAVPVAWAFCRLPKPLGENGPVHSGCLTGELATLGPPTPTIAAAIPGDACRLFGPETPPAIGNTPPARTRDPDATGGYHQPIVVTGIGDPVVATVRITCNVATAPLEVAADLRRRYRPNENPAPPEILVLVDGVPLDRVAVPTNRPLTLVARWSPDAAEAYLAFDPASQAVVERREAMRLSWFASSGTVATPRAGRTETDSASEAATTWRPDPASPTTVHLWAVLQDSRGGAAVAHRELDVFDP